MQRELVIANGTLKSHTRRIYQKLGIHTKRELQAMVGENAPSESKA
ncbi:MAG: LuxR C-terminal-related transcriptional regulator [Gordonibacter sp.]